MHGQKEGTERRDGWSGGKVEKRKGGRKEGRRKEGRKVGRNEGWKEGRGGWPITTTTNATAAINTTTTINTGPITSTSTSTTITRWGETIEEKKEEKKDSNWKTRGGWGGRSFPIAVFVFSSSFFDDDT